MYTLRLSQASRSGEVGLEQEQGKLQHAAHELLMSLLVLHFPLSSALSLPPPPALHLCSFLCLQKII